jgi:hypothetical protein
MVLALCLMNVVFVMAMERQDALTQELVTTIHRPTATTIHVFTTRALVVPMKALVTTTQLPSLMTTRVITAASDVPIRKHVTTVLQLLKTMDPVSMKAVWAAQILKQ